MKLIVGLGNPGGKFEYTRHNIGFMVVDKFVKERLPLAPSLHAWKDDRKMNGQICKLDNCLVLKPMTYMNRSGASVLLVTNFYKISPENIFVVHDDIDLPIGKLRIRTGGASAGHHGIDSIINNLHNPDFVRIRLGIGRGKNDTTSKNTGQNLHRHEVEKYVISLFREDEGGEVKKMIKHGSEALEYVLEKGIEKAMNRYN